MFMFVLYICNKCYLCFFFFKQKTAYEMRISDWSSDVCSSDLEADQNADHEGDHLVPGHRRQAATDRQIAAGHQQAADIAGEDDAVIGRPQPVHGDPEREGQAKRDGGKRDRKSTRLTSSH